MQYIERDGTEYFHTLKVYPEALQKKMTLLKYFRNYMSEHLLKVAAKPVTLAARLVQMLAGFARYFEIFCWNIIVFSYGVISLDVGFKVLFVVASVYVVFSRAD